MAMEQCLDLLSQDNYCNVIIEADFELIINSLKRKNSGTTVEKVSNHWKLIQDFQRIQVYLQNLHTVNFHHVRRKANRLADLLANQGINYIEDKVLMEWKELSQRRLRALCFEHVEEDRRLFRHKARDTSS